MTENDVARYFRSSGNRVNMSILGHVVLAEIHWSTDLEKVYSFPKNDSHVEKKFTFLLIRDDI